MIAVQRNIFLLIGSEFGGKDIIPIDIFLFLKYESIVLNIIIWNPKKIKKINQLPQCLKTSNNTEKMNISIKVDF